MPETIETKIKIKRVRARPYAKVCVTERGERVVPESFCWGVFCCYKVNVAKGAGYYLHYKSDVQYSQFGLNWGLSPIIKNAAMSIIGKVTVLFLY